MKPSKTIDTLKDSLGIRLSYIINNLSANFSNLELSKALDISSSTLYKIKKERFDKVSINLLLSTIERLGLKYTATIAFSGKTRKITVTGLESAVGTKYTAVRRGHGITLQRIA